VTGRRRRRCKQLLVDLKENRGYCKLKEEALGAELASEEAVDLAYDRVGKSNKHCYCIVTFRVLWKVCNLPSGLTFKNSTCCPHSVLMCFVWISEVTAIISLHSVK